MFYLLLLSLEIMQLPFMHPFYNTFPSKDMVGTCRLRERNCYLKQNFILTMCTICQQHIHKKVKNISKQIIFPNACFLQCRQNLQHHKSVHQKCKLYTIYPISKLLKTHRKFEVNHLEIGHPNYKNFRKKNGASNVIISNMS